MMHKNNSNTSPEMKSLNSHRQSDMHCERHKSQPIKFKLKRTDSEIQLKDDEDAANFRDYCMYVRIMSRLHGQLTHYATGVHPFESDMQARAKGSKKGSQHIRTIHDKDIGYDFETDVEDENSYFTPPPVYPPIDSEDFDLDDAPGFFSIDPSSKEPTESQFRLLESIEEGIFDIEL
eukprot:CAMPEP_0194213712 /NCGR_PEP_ID=MMETSP0156-20130528/14499_1 /TAXON_ID=33649 /ORGANISM="Thalassionema nitzschioides, Strain L26-B" /LENGTH=176 /DNA_ID=CAMNT_0038941809 /DNA_START=119 /DNA_END=649 /DNA_ORIENTATION=-